MRRSLESSEPDGRVLKFRTNYFGFTTKRHMYLNSLVRKLKPYETLEVDDAIILHSARNPGLLTKKQVRDKRHQFWQGNITLSVPCMA